jgi:hypothetical protein
MFTSAHDFPKLVKVGAAMEHELRKVGTRAANLKFLSVSLQVRPRNFKFKAALESYIF